MPNLKVKYQHMQELSPNIDLFQSPQDPSAILLSRWKSADKEDGWGNRTQTRNVKEIEQAMRGFHSENI
ncbi:MAG: hypothetical protein ACXAC8_19680 [Candidatus Hodarchaeales archaeon]|jgi:hypothetical protein